MRIPLALLLFLTACGDGPPADPAADPPGATGSPEALALARRVQEFAGGGEAWSGVRTLLLTFRGAERVFWDRAAGKVRVETVAGDAGPSWTAAVHDIAAGEDVFRGEGGEGEPVSAHGRWINHTYWLLAPLKVLDPGVHLGLEPREEDDPEGVRRLRLRFEQVGLTPQNEYVLHVEEATGRVVRWDFHRQAGSEPRSWTLEGWTEIGPLHLALRHEPIGHDTPVHLTGVRVDLEPPGGVWSDRGRILGGLAGR